MLSGIDTSIYTEESELIPAESSSEQSEDQLDVSSEADEKETNLLQTMLAPELQIAILLHLVQDEDFFEHLYAFMRTSKWSYLLAHDQQLWQAVAKHWSAPENINKLSTMQLAGIFVLFAAIEQDASLSINLMMAAQKNEQCYLLYSQALNIAASQGHLASTQFFLKRVSGFSGPHYVGEALKTVARKGYFDLAKILTDAILTKGKHGRDRQLQSACRLALEHQHWDIVSLLMEQDACRQNDELLSEVLHAAAKAGQSTMVKQITKNSSQLSLLDKLSVLTQPGYQHSGVSLDDLFSNTTWLVRGPLCFALGKLGYQPQPSEEVDVDVVNGLLADFSIDELESTEVAEPTLSALGVRKQ